MSQAAETFLLSNTLSFVVGLSVGKVTTVELRNEAHATGRITEVDGFMNVTMREVQFVDPTGREKKFDHFFVPCRLIRYVQIPTEVDIRGAIKKQFDPEAGSRGRGRGRGRSDTEFKVGGARKKIQAIREKRRQEDIATAMAMKKEMTSKREEKS